MEVDEEGAVVEAPVPLIEEESLILEAKDTCEEELLEEECTDDVERPDDDAFFAEVGANVGVTAPVPVPARFSIGTSSSGRPSVGAAAATISKTTELDFIFGRGWYVGAPWEVSDFIL